MLVDDVLQIINEHEISSPFVRGEQGADFGGGNVAISKDGQMQANKGITLAPMNYEDVPLRTLYLDASGALCFKDHNGETRFV